MLLKYYVDNKTITAISLKLFYDEVD